ncbi:MAG TPA: hypothetical protein VE010_13950, partial [Thermoanaerobaculia bacterium]|nr:hypothetical protein [Thermoanaerobaculia bacterium]
MSATRAAFSLLLIAFLARAAGATNVSGALTSSTTWTAANNPYVVTSTVTVNSGVTLTIEPGVTVSFNSGTGLTVSGTLRAIGTSMSRITFTSSAATPAAGAWRTIFLQAPATQLATEIAYADVLYGGAQYTGATYYGTIHVTNGAPALTNVTVA